MAIVRAQISTAIDSLFPADRVMITPHFKLTALFPTDDPNWTDLGDDLFDVWKVWAGATYGTAETSIKFYNAEDVTPPNYPLWEKTYQAGISPVALSAREVALCLSFYAGQNRPRHRGRLYLPAFMIAGSSQDAPRPSAAHQQKAADLVPGFSGLGGVNVDWVVWSRADHAGRTITNWWVDNAWDVQRRRGLRPTQRLQGTTSG